MQIDGLRYQRGAVIGAWTRQGTAAVGARPADARTLEALAGLLAAPRSLGFVDDQVPVAYRVTLAITPPAGPPTEHVLEPGASRAAGCSARIGRDTVLLPVAVCAQVAALAK